MTWNQQTLGYLQLHRPPPIHPLLPRHSRCWRRSLPSVRPQVLDDTELPRPRPRLLRSVDSYSLGRPRSGETAMSYRLVHWWYINRGTVVKSVWSNSSLTILSELLEHCWGIFLRFPAGWLAEDWHPPAFQTESVAGKSQELYIYIYWHSVEWTCNIHFCHFKVLHLQIIWWKAVAH